MNILTSFLIILLFNVVTFSQLTWHKVESEANIVYVSEPFPDKNKSRFFSKTVIDNQTQIKLLETDCISTKLYIAGELLDRPYIYETPIEVKLDATYNKVYNYVCNVVAVDIASY